MKQSIYTEVTNQILEALKAGVRPWEQCYDGIKLPIRSNGEFYQGINTLILLLSLQKNQFTSSYWLTFNQARQLKASVKKGSKSTKIIFYKTLEVENEDSDEPDKIPMIKTYNVFNASQIENLPDDYRSEQETRDNHPIEVAEQFFHSIDAKLSYFDCIPHYSISKDYIGCPVINSFSSSEQFYATLGHEFVHWTGHSTRLDRNINTDDKKQYAYEELIAEIGSAFILPKLGIEPLINEEHAPYINLLENDHKLIFKAAAEAQKATEYLINHGQIH
ncbi:ArdC family protein [Marinicella sp. W31]|uniref:ArdC family protein n=1 Tax=Marinicella sp. W31 TaxID=3023713 RepID=UPI0037578158